MLNILNQVPGIYNAGLFHIVGQPNLEIRIDRQKCARYGINVADVEAVVQVAIGGGALHPDGRGGEEVRHRAPPAGRAARRPGGHRPHPGRRARGEDGKPGARIPLRQLADIEPHKPGATYIYRENNRRYIPIKFSVQGRDLASTIHEAEAKVDDPKARRPAAQGL